jgi:hypothetical protein
MPSVEQVSKNAAWGGSLYKFKGASQALGGLETSFNVFVPSESAGASFPVLYYLAGLTCTEDTGAQKGGFLRDAVEHGGLGSSSTSRAADCGSQGSPSSSPTPLRAEQVWRAKKTAGTLGRVRVAQGKRDED